MIGICRPAAYVFEVWRAALLLTFASAAAAAVSPEGKVIHAVEQRLTLASQLIQRMPDGEARQSFATGLEALQTRFLERVDEVLAADANAFLQQVMAGYRAVAPAAKSPNSERERQRYEAKQQQVQAFHESYLALIEERGEQVRSALDEEKFHARLVSAAELASAGKYAGAYLLADDANHQLIEALRELRDKETVEYRLEFASAAEEYAYETRRFQSQTVLLEMLIAEKEPSLESRTLIQSFVGRANSMNSQAEALAKAGDFKQAVDEQEGAVRELVKAMRLVGVYF
jgi:hypothetical protein